MLPVALSCPASRSTMNANDQFFARDAQVDAAAVAPLPASQKIYVQGSRADIRVPMREITQSETPASLRGRRKIRRSPSTTRPVRTPTRRRRSTSAAACRRCARRGSPSATTRSSSTARRRATAARGWPTRSWPASASTCCARRAARAGRQRLPDALRPPRHRHAGDGVHRDPREPEARRDAGDDAGDRDAPARRAELRRRACRR